VLRPLSRYIDQRSLAGLEAHVLYRVRLVCPRKHLAEAEYQVTRVVAERSLRLRELRAEKVEGTDNAVVQAILESPAHDSDLLNALADELRAIPWVQSVEWTETSAEGE
jgi:putative Mg2+ transporter-C (MgtC) family protein